MIKEIIAESNILTYGDWKKAQSDLDDKVDELSMDLNKFPRETTGLVSNKTRNSKEYKYAKHSYYTEFNNLRMFNKNSPKEFMKQNAKEMRQSRGNR